MGPGLQTTQPPWKPEYAHMQERVKAIGLPPVGKETFHIHAMLHIYVNGLLSPIPADIGIEVSKGRRRASTHTTRRGSSTWRPTIATPSR